jgi:hypothetical protein
MPTSPTPALKELWDAFDAVDANRIRAIFSTTTFQPEKSQALSEEYLGQAVTLDDMVRVLLENGGSAKQLRPTDLKKCNSIHLVHFLAKEGLNFTEEGHLILEYCAHDREILDLLLDQVVDINWPDERRDTLGRYLPPTGKGPTLFNKILGILNNTAALGDIELFDHLVSRGADISKSIVLHTATDCPFPIKTKAMIIHLIEKYVFDSYGDDNAVGLRKLSGLGSGPGDSGVPLEFAIIHRNPTAAQVLFEKEADPNKKTTPYCKYCIRSPGGC